jgi:hypothetical protein
VLFVSFVVNMEFFKKRQDYHEEHEGHEESRYTGLQFDFLKLMTLPG